MVNVPYPDMSCAVALNARPNSSDNPRWTDLTELVQQANQISRGHPYQVPQGQASTPVVTIRDPQDLFNPANTVDSPFVNGTGGRNIQPYRAICWQALHPRGGTGNLWNLNNWRVPIDPSFESYAVGALPVGAGTPFNYSGNAPTITTTTPQQGTKCVQQVLAGGVSGQGLFITMATMPGRYYLVQAQVRQSAANTLSMAINGHANLASTTTTGAYVKLSGVFWADQPSLQLFIGVNGSALASTNLIDAIMYEAVTPLNPATNTFNGPNGGAGTTSGWNNSGSGTTLSVSGAGVAGYHLRALKIHPDSVNVPKAASPDIPVSPNTPYALHGIVLNPSINRNVTVWWYTAGGAFISSNTINLTGSGEWTVFGDPPAVFTSPGTAAKCQVGTEATIVATSDWWVDSISLLPTTPSAFTTSGPVIYPVLRDWVERWPRRYGSNGFEGFSDLQLVDGFAALSAIQLPTELVSAILATSPNYYWRLNEEAGAVAFSESSGNAGPQLVRFDDPDDGPADNFGGGQPLNLAGDRDGSGVAIGENSPPASPQLNSSGIAAGGPQGAGRPKPQLTISAVPFGYTDMFFMSHTTNNVFNNNFDCEVSFAANRLWGLSWAWSNGIFEFIGSLDAAGVTNFGPLNITDKWADGNMHMYVATVSASGANVVTNVYVDNVLAATDTQPIAASFQLPKTLDWVQVGATLQAPNILSTPLPNGVWAHRALWNRTLSAGEMTSIFNASKGITNELAGARIARRLTAGGYQSNTNNIPPNRLSSTGRSLLSAVGSPDKVTALVDAQRTTLAEMGTLWIAPDGALVMESRDDRFLRTTPSLTFGEDFAGGECPYLEGSLYDYDPLYLYANVQITQTDGYIATGGRTVDIQAATSQFFGRSFTPADTVDLVQLYQVQDYADWTFYTHNVPTQRVEAVTIDPMGNPALWPFVLGVEVGQRVRVRRRPRGLAGNLVIDQQYFVEQVVHGQINLDASGNRPLSWRTSLSLTPAGANSQPWILDDATWSVLGNTTRLGV